MPERAVKIAPSILAADFLKLGEQVREVEQAGADRLHIDVMDGQFVPNISMGIPVVEALRRGTSLPLETHLMIERPERYVEAFIHAGSDTIIVHQENSPHLHRTVQLIKGHKKRAGVTINPATPVSVLEPILEEVGIILIMTVNPGFGGQHFIEGTLGKIMQVRKMIDRSNPECELEVDGGIDAKTTTQVVQAGANVLVAGTAVFGDKGGPGAGVRRLLDAARSSA